MGNEFAHPERRMAESNWPRGEIILFGPHANCDLDKCDPRWSVLEYRPSVAANTMLILFWLLFAFIHWHLGKKWRSQRFGWLVVGGCIFEVLGYVGRILMYQNPWSYYAYLIQFLFILTGPVWFTAAIFLILPQTIEFLPFRNCPVKPKRLYWYFGSLTILCFVLQCVGGIVSTLITSGEDVMRHGLLTIQLGMILQIFSILLFSVYFLEYLWKWRRSFDRPSLRLLLSFREVVFIFMLSFAATLLCVRCIYWYAVLKPGYYESDDITHEALFIGFEGLFTLSAVLALCIGHPGFGYMYRPVASIPLPQPRFTTVAAIPVPEATSIGGSPGLPVIDIEDPPRAAIGRGSSELGQPPS